MLDPLLDHHDWMQILGGAASTALLITVALVGWLARHAQRLTIVERDVQLMREVRAEDLRRTEVVWLDIRARLARIEDKLDRKVDR